MDMTVMATHFAPVPQLTAVSSPVDSGEFHSLVCPLPVAGGRRDTYHQPNHGNMPIHGYIPIHGQKPVMPMNIGSYKPLAGLPACAGWLACSMLGIWKPFLSSTGCSITAAARTTNASAATMYLFILLRLVCFSH